MGGYTVRAYDEIINGTGKDDGFKDTKATLRGEHKAATTDELPEPRCHQVKLADKTALLMEAAGKGKSERARIFTGTGFIEMAIIAETYGESLFDALKPDSKTRSRSILSPGSTYFRSLIINFGITEENKPEEEDIATLIAAGRDYMASHVYIEGKSVNGFKKQHDYSDIANLDVPLYLKKGNQVVHEASDRAVDRNNTKLKSELEKDRIEEEEKLRQLREKEKSNQPGVLQTMYNFIGGTSPKKTGEKVEEEKKEITP